MSKKIAIPKKNIGHGYVGTWEDGKIGWFMPRHVYGIKDSGKPSIDDQNKWMKGDRMFLCKITIEPIIRNKKPITRIVK